MLRFFVQKTFYEVESNWIFMSFRAQLSARFVSVIAIDSGCDRDLIFSFDLVIPHSNQTESETCHGQTHYHETQAQKALGVIHRTGGGI